MKKALTATLAALALATAPALHAQETAAMTYPATTHTLTSKYNYSDTLNRLTHAIEQRGMTLFATIDHQAAAQKAGLDMQPATVLIFGAPKAGTPLMVKDPALALQLPLKVLVTETGGQVRVIYNDTRALLTGSKIEYSEVENTLAKAETLIRKTVTE